MPQDISGSGVQIIIIANNTYPTGLPITAFSDDADPITMGNIPIGSTAMTLNGLLATWSSPAAIPVTLNVLPGSDDDIALSILGDNNRVGRGKVSARDIITMVAVYPDGGEVTLTGGKLVNYDPGRSISGAGRQKTKTYSFMFENKV